MEENQAMSETPPVVALAEEVQRAIAAHSTKKEASAILTRSRELGLISDWDLWMGHVTEKPFDFACLVVAVAHILPPGGSIETGVFRGGTSALLIQCATPETFHVAIDPFGLPSQSCAPTHGYELWAPARTTIARLAALSEHNSVTFRPYVMGAREFIRADLLQHPAPFRIVHLDGEHSNEGVTEELQYFRRKLRGPAVIIIDDHDEHSPGVASALDSPAANGLVPILHRFYLYPTVERPFGFSAWLHPAAS